MRKVSMKRKNKKEKKDAGGKNVQENGVESSEDKQNGSENDVKNREESVEPEKKKRKSDKRKSVSFSKKGEKEDTKEEKQSSKEESEDDSQFEVEAILDEDVNKGVRYYLIRWKGYGPESDTWEPESTLNCADLIKEFRESRKNSNKKGAKKNKKEKKIKKKEESKEEEEWDENEQFEVDRILEVHFKRNGGREFLVSWKGYPQSQNSWEPEENLECPDLIKKFMAKVEQAKNREQKELRVYRKPTKRLTLAMQDKGRRLSRRLSGRERVHYHDAE